MSARPGNFPRPPKSEHIASVLIVDDCEINIQTLSFHLEDEGHSVYSALNGEQAIECVKNQNIDLILLDIQMPGMDGIQVLKNLKSGAEFRDIPVIMVSSSNCGSDITQALDLGAHDYVTKPVNADVLAARMRSALRLSFVVRQLEKVNARLEREATSDSLTGLNNRRQYMKLSSIEFVKGLRNKRTFAVMILDVDNFKTINDQFGHPVGDRVLCNLAKVLRSKVRQSDIVCRLGGEEFAVSFPETTLNEAVELSERLRLVIAQQTVKNEFETIKYTVSIGVACMIREDHSVEDVLARADQCLYTAKRRGKNRVVGKACAEGLQAVVENNQSQRSSADACNQGYAQKNLTY